jgi:release factor glutamine methyltransferase
MSEAPTIRGALESCGLVPLDAQVLLAHVLGKERAWLRAHAAEPLARADVEHFLALAKRRRSGEPVAYLTGVREFWGLPIEVSPAVLIPRPETEALVELALARLPPDREARALDLGTGSGAVALALAHERPRTRVLAIDADAAALDIARANAARLAIGNVEFVQSDWYDALPVDGYCAAFALIVANPPYVAASDPHLAEGDVRFEPRSALTAGGDGLDAIRAIVTGARVRLAPGGTLAVEHGYDQAERVRALFGATGFVDIVGARDLAGIARLVAGRVE